jgi:death-on-curing protein
MHRLQLAQILELQERVVAESGGARGLLDFGALESAVAQPWMTFGGVDLYSTLVEKAAALCFSLVMNHPFVDGNKRVGHAAMEVFLVLNGHEINAPTAEQEGVILDVAAGRHNRAQPTEWLSNHLIPLPKP